MARDDNDTLPTWPEPKPGPAFKRSFNERLRDTLQKLELHGAVIGNRLGTQMALRLSTQIVDLTADRFQELDAEAMVEVSHTSVTSVPVTPLAEGGRHVLPASSAEEGARGRTRSRDASPSGTALPAPPSDDAAAMRNETETWKRKFTAGDCERRLESIASAAAKNANAELQIDADFKARRIELSRLLLDCLKPNCLVMRRELMNRSVELGTLPDTPASRREESESATATFDPKIIYGAMTAALLTARPQGEGALVDQELDRLIANPLGKDATRADWEF